MTDDEVLAAIEDFEDNPPGAGEPSSEERIAAALEAQVMMAEPEAAAVSLAEVDAVSEGSARMSTRAAAGPSPALGRVKRNFERGLWSSSMVQAAAGKGYITADEAEAILAAAKM